MLDLKISILDSDILDPTNYASPRIGLTGTACRSSMTKLVSPRDIGEQAEYKLKQGKCFNVRQGVCILRALPSLGASHLQPPHQLHIQGGQQGGGNKLKNTIGDGGSTAL